jgi:hypothetical protein
MACNRDIFTFISRRWVVNFTPRPLHPRGKSPPRYPLDRRLGGPQKRSGLSRHCEEEKILEPTGTRTPTFRKSSPYPVAVPTALLIVIITKLIYSYSLVSRLHSQDIWCGICGVRSGTGMGFLRILLFPLPVFIPSTPPYIPHIPAMGSILPPPLNDQRRRT